MDNQVIGNFYLRTSENRKTRYDKEPIFQNNILADIGNGTMNIMYINNSRPLEKKCFTEKYGTHQCVHAVRESLLKELGTVVDDPEFWRI